MKILFLCKHNRFRSIAAETIFNTEIKKFLSHKLPNKQEVSDKLNKNSEIKAESAGINLDELRPYVENSVIKIMKEKGYNVKGKPRQLTRDLIRNFDLLVVMADNVDLNFNGFEGKIIRWKIPDVDASNFPGIKKTIEEIERKVKKLIVELENKKV